MWFRLALSSWSWRTPFAYAACLGALSVAAAVLVPRASAPERDAFGRRRSPEEWVPPESSADVARNQRVAERRASALFEGNLTLFLLLAGFALLAIGAAPFVMMRE